MTQPNMRATSDGPSPGDDRERLMRAATGLAERGWHVFPCQPGGKRPALRHDWEQRATIDPDRITRCWATGAYNIGIACGPSGLVVVDLDTPKPDHQPPPEWAAEPGIRSGGGVLATLCERHRQPWPGGTFTVATPSCGAHLYFTAPPGPRLRNTAGRLGWLIDTRATGGYVIGPDSIIGGHRYEVTNDEPPAPLPAWIVSLLTEPDTPPPAAGPPHPGPGGAPGTGYALAALRGEIGRVLAARPSTRNNTLNEAAFALGQLAAADMLPAELARDALAEAARAAGLPADEAARTITSGLGAGARHPRGSAA